IAVDAAGLDEDTLMGIVLDAGADDLKRSGGHFEVTTDAAAFGHVKAALEKAGVKIDNAEVAQVPKVAVDVDEETGKKLVRLMEAREDHDDVQNVHRNANWTGGWRAGAPPATPRPEPSGGALARSPRRLGSRRHRKLRAKSCTCSG